MKSEKLAPGQLPLIGGTDSFPKKGDKLSWERRRQISLLTTGKAKSGKNQRGYDNWQGKAFCLQAPDGRLIEGKNLHQFCLDNNLSYDCIRKILEGEGYQHKGYSVPGVKKPARGKPFRLVSPDGVVCVGKNIKAFAKQMGLSSQALTHVINGKAKHHKGWSLNGDVEGCQFGPSKYHFVSPQGTSYKGENITAFADSQGLQRSGLFAVHWGLQKTHHGWRKGSDDGWEDGDRPPD